MELSIRSIVVSDDDNVIISGDVLGQNDWRTAFYIKIVCNDKVLIKREYPNCHIVLNLPVPMWQRISVMYCMFFLNAIVCLQYKEKYTV